VGDKDRGARPGVQNLLNRFDVLTWSEFTLSASFFSKLRSFFDKVANDLLWLIFLFCSSSLTQKVQIFFQTQK
jgi:hypothetical protein